MTTLTADALTDAKLDALPTALARARACTPLTLRDVSDATGMAASQICGYETGKLRAGPRAQRRLADFYGVEVDDLFPHRGQETP